MRNTVMAAGLILAASPAFAEAQFNSTFAEFADLCFATESAGGRLFEECMDAAALEVAAIVDRLTYISPKLSELCDLVSRNVFDQVECMITTHQNTRAIGQP